jgi:hypothetical protein
MHGRNLKKLLGKSKLIPTVPNFPLGEICKWLKHADCKSVLLEFAGSNPALTTILKRPSERAVFFYGERPDEEPASGLT